MPRLYICQPQSLRLMSLYLLAITRLGFVSQQCQPKAVRASIVLSNGTVYCEIELKRMDWILESSAASAFEFSGNVGSSTRQACARTNSQHDECICFRTSSAIRSCCCINEWTTGTSKKIGEVEFPVYSRPLMPPAIKWPWRRGSSTS